MSDGAVSYKESRWDGLMEVTCEADEGMSDVLLEVSAFRQREWPEQQSGRSLACFRNRKAARAVQLE